MADIIYKFRMSECQNVRMSVCQYVRQYFEGHRVGDRYSS